MVLCVVMNDANNIAKGHYRYSYIIN